MFNKFKQFWVGIWNVIKSMGNWRGVLSLLIVWLILSGVGLSIIGFITAIPKLYVIGGIMFVFWAGPATPLIPIVIVLAMLMQRFIFRDKSITIKNIKEQFSKSFAKEEENENKSED